MKKDADIDDLKPGDFLNNTGVILRNPKLQIEVKLNDDTILTKTYDALGWLSAKGYRNSIDWDVDMHAGLTGYTTFYFASPDLAAEFSLVFI